MFLLLFLQGGFTVDKCIASQARQTPAKRKLAKENREKDGRARRQLAGIDDADGKKSDKPRLADFHKPVKVSRRQVAILEQMPAADRAIYAVCNEDFKLILQRCHQLEKGQVQLQKNHQDMMAELHKNTSFSKTAAMQMNEEEMAARSMDASGIPWHRGEDVARAFSLGAVHVSRTADVKEP